jgi:type II restriction enzyme
VSEPTDAARLSRITDRLPKLHSEQLAFLDTITERLLVAADYWSNPKSDLVTADILRNFGDILRIHHCFSVEPFSKDRFEYAFQKTLSGAGVEAALAPRGNPGHDLTIRGVPTSLKTEAAANTKANAIHISKFMELGRGVWSDKPDQLEGLRDRFFHHMRSYERIFTLRRLKASGSEHYELVEIPKALLNEAANGALEMRMDSTQTPKPGYCTVRDAVGRIRFRLYFDGGTERKLQVKSLDKSLCVVHATWRFNTSEQNIL